MLGNAFKLGAILACLVFLSLNGIFAKVEDLSVFAGEQDMSVSYCFKFTWLGPKWDNTSKLNTTCKDFTARPCQEPLVITHDSSPPNTTFMWENFDISQITVEGQSRTNWEGCEIEHTNSTSKVVCACRSSPGEKPCNSTPPSFASPVFTLLAISLIAVVFAGFM